MSQSSLSETGRRLAYLEHELAQRTEALYTAVRLKLAAQDECDTLRGLLREALEAMAKATKAWPLSCDQVALLNDALERFARTVGMNHLGISRLPQAAQLAALIEIMEICGLYFADEAARNNAICRFKELRQGVSDGQV